MKIKQLGESRNYQSSKQRLKREEEKIFLVEKGG